MRAARKGRPGEQPPPRAPHASDQVLGAGVTYVVKYLGCIEVLRSMRSLDFSTRTQITRSCCSFHGPQRPWLGPDLLQHHHMDVTHSPACPLARTPNGLLQNHHVWKILQKHA
uniref:SHC-transforming protein 3 isoform X1 n=1 Tax=Halichoerus grypus TaxID=9711 RepID=UPI0016591299|nr:SHC-transforming protein 3 isoform X1 [Halichoerus grypus]